MLALEITVVTERGDERATTRFDGAELRRAREHVDSSETTTAMLTRTTTTTTTH